MLNIYDRNKLRYAIFERLIKDTKLDTTEFRDVREWIPELERSEEDVKAAVAHLVRLSLVKIVGRDLTVHLTDHGVVEWERREHAYLEEFNGLSRWQSDEERRRREDMARRGMLTGGHAPLAHMRDQLREDVKKKRIDLQRRIENLEQPFSDRPGGAVVVNSGPQANFYAQANGTVLGGTVGSQTFIITESRIEEAKVLIAEAREFLKQSPVPEKQARLIEAGLDMAEEAIEKDPTNTSAITAGMETAQKGFSLASAVQGAVTAASDLGARFGAWMA